MLALSLAAQEAPAPVRVDALALPAEETLASAFATDVDRDGTTDVVLLVRGVGEQILVRAHRARAEGGLEPRALFETRATSDVAALAVADVDPAPGAELVLLGAAGAFVYRPLAPEDARYARLFEARLLWQVGDDGEPVLWQSGVRDVDGDGLDDLLLPEPGGYLLALQRRDAEASGEPGPSVRFERFAFPLPEDERPAPDARGSGARRRGGSVELRLGFGGDDEGPPLVGLRLELPAPILADEDGDGALDLLAYDRDRLVVWRQRRATAPRFVAVPDVVAPAPLAPGEERRLDPSFRVETRDLDGDRRTDLLLSAGDRRASEPRTQILAWRGSEPGDPFAGGRPSQLVVLGGIGRIAELVDVDGNGAPDLVCTVLRTDRLGALDFLGDDEVPTELDVFLNEGGRLGPRAALTCELRVGEEAFGAPARFVQDANGDGIAELLVREGSGRLVLRRIARRDGGLALDRPLWELEGGLGEDARLVFAADDAPPRALLVVEERGLRLVSFR